MRVKLINLDVHDRFDLVGSRWVPPLGLISIATYLREQTGISPTVYDSTIDDEQKICTDVLEGCNADTVLGFYVSVLNYSKVISLAQRAKNMDATIILGGPHVSSLEKVILQTRPYVDGVVSGQGELPLALLLDQAPLERIPNLTYRKNGGVAANDRMVFDLNSLNLDYSFVDLTKYWCAFSTRRRNGFSRPVSYYTHKGCNWGKCIFCAIPTRGSIRKQPRKVWEEVQLICSDHQVDYIYETGDSFADEPGWLEELARTRPKSLSVAWDILARAPAISVDTVKHLKEVGVHRICIGIETGDPELLRKMRKGHTIDDVIRASKLLKRFDIRLVPSFICGTLGETRSSLEKTVSLAERIREISDSDEVLVFPFIPLPNSPSYRMLLAKQSMHEKYADRDLFDIEELHRDWCDHFCNVDVDEIRAAMSRVKNAY